MKINWVLISIVIFFALLLITFLIKRNRKDEKNLEKFYNKQSKLEENESELNEDEEN